MPALGREKEDVRPAEKVSFFRWLVGWLLLQTVILKVHIHCDGCKQEVKKLLQKIEGDSSYLM